MSDDPEVLDKPRPYKGKKRGAKKGVPAKQKSGRKPRLNQEQTFQALALSKQGVPLDTLADLYNAPRSTVHVSIQRLSKQLEHFKEELQDIDAFRDAQGELIDAAKFKALKSLMDPAKHEAATLRDAGYAFQQLYHAGRLERGLSTSNLATLSFTVPSLRKRDEQGNE